MTQQALSLTPELADYLRQISLRESPAQFALRTRMDGHRLAKMQSSPEQAQLLALLARLMGVKRYLEIGVFTGYSTLSVAQALPTDSEIIGCEINPQFVDLAREHWRMAGVDERISLRIGPALESLAQLVAEGRTAQFDMAFIDADKARTPDYFEYCMQLVRPGGLILIDNVFLGGRVLNPNIDNLPPSVAIMTAFNRQLLTDPRISLSVLPYGDGLTLALRHPAP